MVRIRLPSTDRHLERKISSNPGDEGDVSQRSPITLCSELLRHLPRLYCRLFEVFLTETTQNGVQRTESAESHGTTYCILLIVTKKLTY